MRTWLFSLVLLAVFSNPLAFATTSKDTLAKFPQLVEFAKSKGILLNVKKLTPGRLAPNSTFEKYVLSISFGPLTDTQFQELQQYFGGYSQVTYVAKKSYELIDFLPPVIQALVNKTFESYSTISSKEAMRIKDEELSWNLQNGIEVFANCWNTVWQVQRLLQPANTDANYYLYWPGRYEADQTLKSDKHSLAVDLKERTPGDALIISARSDTNSNFYMIQHTAIFVTPEIVFEKTNGGKNDPFRLSFAVDVLKNYRRIFGRDLKFEVRRFNKADAIQLPTPSLKDNEIAKKIRAAFPKKRLEPMYFGAEIGLGGGNKPTVSGILVFQIAIDPVTKRGVLRGASRDLARFKGL